MAANRPPFMLSFDVHVAIVKLLNLRDALAYAQITPVTREAVQYVFCHRVQLDFGSVLGPNGQIMLPDDTIMEVLRAHVRAQAITLHRLLGAIHLHSFHCFRAVHAISLDPHA